MKRNERLKVARALLAAASVLSANDKLREGKGRVFLLDGERTTFEALVEANEEEEEFIDELLALKVGKTMVWGGGAAAEFKIKRLK